MLLEKALSVIKRDNLLEVVKDSAAVMKKGFLQLQDKFPKLVSNSRGRGTFRAFDMPDMKLRDQFLTEMRNSGVQIGGSGPTSVRFRPALIFQPHHAEILVDITADVLKSKF